MILSIIDNEGDSIFIKDFRYIQKFDSNLGDNLTFYIYVYFSNTRLEIYYDSKKKRNSALNNINIIRG